MPWCPACRQVEFITPTGYCSGCNARMEKPMPHLNENYLPLVMEEAGEVLQAIGKIQRFGVDHKWVSEGCLNFEALAFEIGDLLEVIDRLGLDPALIEQGRERKRERLKTYAPENWKP